MSTTLQKKEIYAFQSNINHLFLMSDKHTLFFSYAQKTKLNTKNDKIEMKRHHISNRFKILLANSSEYLEIQAEVMCL